MKVTKRCLFSLTIAVLMLGPARWAAATSISVLPVNDGFSFYMTGTNAILIHNIPSTSASGTFTVKSTSSTAFNITNGTLVLSDPANSALPSDDFTCTANFTGTGVADSSTQNSGTMTWNLTSISGATAPCTVLTDNPTVTIYYGVASNPALLVRGNNTVLFIEDATQDTYTLLGTANAQ